MTHLKLGSFLAGFLAVFLIASPAWADADPDYPPSEDPGQAQQFGQETAQVQTPPIPQNPNVSGMGDVPRVQTTQEAELARRFAWWPSDAKPAPVKDEDRRGYWWWPDQPGQVRPWGNQGYIYIIKVIYDYKSAEGELKPSLIIKRIIKNVKVYFNYDKSELRDDAIGALDKALYTLEKNPKADILITGNADVRGSEQYNLKLAERRADEVRGYLIGKGLPDDRIRILSRGKMDAIAPTNDLVGMQQDRNAQFMIAEVEEVMIPASQAKNFEDKVVEEQKTYEGEIRVSEKEYVIQPGDTLWKIAEAEYGNGMQWKRIYEYNKDVIADPNKPRKGTRIRLPIE